MSLRRPALWALRLDKKSDERLRYTTWAAERSTFPCWRSGAGVVEVKSTNGDTHLGGDDVDQRIVDWLIDEFKKENNIDLSTDRMALQAAEGSGGKSQDRAFADDGNGHQSPVHHAGAAGPIHMQVKLTRMRLEQLNGRFVGTLDEAGEAGFRRREDVAE